jgi:hypothetical protein
MDRVRAFADMGGLIAPGTDAGAWAVFHGMLSEYELLEEALGTGAAAVLEHGTTALMTRF